VIISQIIPYFIISNCCK